MGQKKIKVVDLSKKEEAKKKPAKDGSLTKASETPTEPKVKADKAAEPAKSKEHLGGSTADKKQQLKKPRPKKVHSRRYRKLRTLIDRKKLYPLAEGIKLLLKVSNSKMDETVELHISTRVEKLTGSVNLPHGTGKKQKIAIADERLIDTIRKGKIDFDILIAPPSLMPKLARVAKILGPKGLMPNPKAGTIGNNPEAIKKKLEAGETRFKTEPKFPLLHMVIGKISFGEKKLLENLEALIKIIKPNNIKKAVLTSTHSPGIKLEVSS